MVTMSITRTLILTAAVAVPVLAVANALPVASTFGPARNRLLPRLSGKGRPDHVALTFDDGPDPKSTPQFLELLQERGVQATFFLLGSMLEKTPSLADEITAAGHEIAVHGWQHRNLLLRTPRATYEDLARARAYIVRVRALRGLAPWPN
jgi:peptidoglycan-N-acetylglucosamine deacetylase